MRWRVEAVGGLAVLAAPRHHYLSGRTRAETLTPIGTLSFECTQTTKETISMATSTLQQDKHVQILNNKLVVRVNLLDNSQTVLLLDPTASVQVACQWQPNPRLLRLLPISSSSCCCLLSAYQCCHLSHTGFVLYVCLFSLACNRSPACSALVAVSVCRMLSLPLVSRWRCPMIPICTSTLHCTSALMASQVRACVPCSESNKR